MTIIDLVVSPDLEKQQDQCFIDHGIDQLQGILADLSRRDRELMELRYGINELGTKTYQGISQIINISKQRVRQIESKCLRKMRSKIDPIRRARDP